MSKASEITKSILDIIDSTDRETAEEYIKETLIDYAVKQADKRSDIMISHFNGITQDSFDKKDIMIVINSYRGRSYEQSK